MSYPQNLLTIYTLVDNVDDVLATHPNVLSAEVRYLEDKIGIDSSAVVTSIDYFLKHASGAYRTHTHDGSSDDGAQLDWDSCWSDAVHNHTSNAEGGLINLTTGITSILPVLNGGTGVSTLQDALNALAGGVTANRVLKGNGSNIVLSQIDLTTNDITGILPRANGGLATTIANNTASGPVFLDSNSKIPIAQLGSWVDKTSSYGAQQATTDGFIIVLGRASASGTYAYFYTDGSSDPTSLKGQIYTNSGTTEIYGNIFCPVKKNDYWKVVNSGVGVMAVYWISLGS